MFVSSVGWISVRPLPYGSIIRFFENSAGESPTRSAALFRRALVGCESVTADIVGQFPVGLPRRLEGAIVAASEFGDDQAKPGGSPEEEEGGGMFAPPEESTELTEYREADLIHTLTERGYTLPDIYGLLIPEIELLNEGAKRAETRRDDGTERNQTSPPARGNRGGSHAADLW